MQAAECKHARDMWHVLGWAQTTVWLGLRLGGKYWEMRSERWHAAVRTQIKSGVVLEFGEKGEGWRIWVAEERW